MCRVALLVTGCGIGQASGRYIIELRQSKMDEDQVDFLEH